MDIFSKAKNMEMVNINLLTVSYMKVNLQITKLMEKVIYIMRNKIINI
jgi:ribosomal protein S8